jgi:hypothetical protein
MADRVPDPSELAEDLARIERAVERGAAETRKAIDALALRIESTYVRQDLYDARHTALTERVSKVEDRHTWIARTSITALLLPILVGVVVAVILASGGVR